MTRFNFTQLIVLYLKCFIMPLMPIVCVYVEEMSLASDIYVLYIYNIYIYRDRHVPFTRVVENVLCIYIFTIHT